MKSVKVPVRDRHLVAKILGFQLFGYGFDGAGTRGPYARTGRRFSHVRTEQLFSTWVPGSDDHALYKKYILMTKNIFTVRSRFFMTDLTNLIILISRLFINILWFLS